MNEIEKRGKKGKMGCLKIKPEVHFNCKMLNLGVDIF